MKLSQLRILVAVAQLGSLRAASRHLSIAQPVITRSIREIEHELGIALFERHSRGIRLTEVGRAFIRRAEGIQAEVRRAREEVEQIKGSLVGEVSVALSTAAAMGLMPRALADFRKRFPDATLKFRETFFGPIEKDLQSGSIDFFVGPYQSRKSAQFVVEELFVNRRLIVARRDHPLSNAASLHELADAQWVRQTLSSQTTEADFESMFRGAGLPPPKIAVHAQSALVTMLAIVHSDLLSVLPQQWINFPMMAPFVAALPIPAFEAAPMCIVRRGDLPLTPLAEHLCDLIRRTSLNYAYDAGPS